MRAGAALTKTFSLSGLCWLSHLVCELECMSLKFWFQICIWCWNICVFLFLFLFLSIFTLLCVKNIAPILKLRANNTVHIFVLTTERFYTFFPPSLYFSFLSFYLFLLNLLPFSLFSFFFLFSFFSSHNSLTSSHSTTPHHTITIRCICVHHHVDCFGYVTHVCLFAFLWLFLYFMYCKTISFVYFEVKTPWYAVMHLV